MRILPNTKNIQTCLDAALDNAIKYLNDNNIYSTTILRSSRLLIQVTEPTNTSPLGRYYRREHKIEICRSLVVKALQSTQTTIRMQTYYLPALGSYVNDMHLVGKDALALVVLHELTHHVQNLRRESHYTMFMYNELEWLNKPRYTNGRSIKTIECETTYNELIWLKAQGHKYSQYINYMADDRRHVIQALSNATLKIEKYVWSGNNSDRKHLRAYIEKYELTYAQLSQIADGYITFSGKIREIKLYKNNSNKNSSYRIYIPSMKAEILSLRYRKMNINKLLGSTIKNQNK